MAVFIIFVCVGRLLGSKVVGMIKVGGRHDDVLYLFINP